MLHRELSIAGEIIASSFFKIFIDTNFYYYLSTAFAKR